MPSHSSDLAIPMPHKHNADRRHHIPKISFKVQNWPAYEAGLRRRGSLLLHQGGVEVVEEFASEAESRLRQIGYSGAEVRVDDGSRGWAEHAPYDKIVATAAADEPPPALLRQLRPGGHMVLPMGADEAQVLTVVHKDADWSVRVREFIPAQFTRLETVI